MISEVFPPSSVGTGLGRHATYMSGFVTLLLLGVFTLVSALLAWLWGSLQLRRAEAVFTSQLAEQQKALELERQHVRHMNEALTAVRQQLDQSKNDSDTAVAARDGELKNLRAHSVEISKQLAQREQQVADLQAQVNTLEERLLHNGEQLNAERQRSEEMGTALATTQEKLKATLVTEEQQAQSEERLKLEFKQLASGIIKESREQLTAEQSERLELTLKPLKENLQHFSNKVEEADKQRIAELAQFKTHFEALRTTSLQLSKGAEGLTSALKSNSKMRGDWGELMLEKILEDSGLREGHEFTRQESARNEEGDLLRPDVVVRLPDNKALVIDSKVSLNAWLEYVEYGGDESEAWPAVVDAVRGRVKELSQKSYDGLFGEGPEYVLLFIPIEPVFIEVLRREPPLFQEAWSKRVILVSATTLMPLLKTVAYVWRGERQHQNVQQIAVKAGQMYDKFTGFLGDMAKVRKGLDNARAAYDDAASKLHEGRGNLVRRSDELRRLGVASAKKIPDQFADVAGALAEDSEAEPQDESGGAELNGTSVLDSVS